MINLAVSGCQGRMGQRITYLASNDSDFKIKTLLEHKGHPKVNEKVNGLTIATDNAALKGCDVLIEFTTPLATLDNLEACVQYGVPIVIGTTGLEPDQIAVVKKESEKIAVILSSNMSIGVNIVFKLTEMAAAKCGRSYGIRMTEAHHIHKKDAPSGTAKTLSEIAEKASGQKVQDIQAIREGEIIGDHSVFFESPEDIITISHHAKSRDIFAKGALTAAKFLVNQKQGLFNMQDVLGLR